MAWLLARRHVDVFVLDGGYRAYRLHLRDLLEPGPRVIGVSGRTRSGKTRALRALAAINHQVVDREALAAHRGSASGDLKGVAQPSNAAFETKCAWAWRALDATRDVFVEDEEGHVGRCLVPQRSTRACGRRRASTDAARVAHLLEDYAADEAAARAARAARLDAALALVAKRLGPDDTARAKQFLDADLAARARLLLDKLYERHLGRRGADAVHAVRADDPFETDAVAADVAVAVSCRGRRGPPAAAARQSDAAAAPRPRRRLRAVVRAE